MGIAGGAKWEGKWEGTTNVAIHPRHNKVEFGATAPEVVGQHD